MIKEYKQFVQVCDACEQENDTIAIVSSREDGWAKIGDVDLCDACYAQVVDTLDKIPGFDKYLKQFIKDKEKYQGHASVLMGNVNTEYTYT